MVERRFSAASTRHRPDIEPDFHRLLKKSLCASFRKGIAQAVPKGPLYLIFETDFFSRLFQPAGHLNFHAARLPGGALGTACEDLLHTLQIFFCIHTDRVEGRFRHMDRYSVIEKA